MSTDSKKLYQTAAYVLTILCLCSTVVLLLFVFFGPREGMEAMVILIPWYIAGLMHIGLGIAAIICVFLTGSLLKNSWILIYFLLFYSFNGYTLAVMNHVDKAIARKVHTVTQSEQAELYELLRTMKLGSSAGHFQLSSSASARAIELVESGKVDLSYISPGYHRSLILMAATTGDTKLVELMLKQGANADGPPSQSHTPLAAAINFELDKVVKVLLDNGADPNDPRYAYPPLVVASREGTVAITRLLLEAGADPDKKTSSSSPALVQAAGKGHEGVVKLLLKHGADPNIVAFGGTTPLVGAVKSDCVECVRLLLKAGADGSGKITRDGTPVAIALKNNNQQMVNLLRGSDQQLGSSGDLFFALNEGDVELLESMLKFGVDPDARDEKGFTVLMSVAEKSQYRQRQQEVAPDVTRLLLENGANPDLTDGTNTTALYRAARTGNTEVAKILIDKGADINITTNIGKQTPLLTAIQKKHNEIARALLQAGADPNKPANWKINESYPLQAAARQNNPEMIRELFAAGAILDPASRDLCDLINYGAKHPEVLRMIVETGVDLNQRDPLKRYPLDIVIKHGNPDSIHYLLQHGVKPILPKFKGLQPFMHFVRNGQADLVAASIEVSPELRENTELMRDGMYWAVRSAHPEVVRVLLEYNSRFRSMAEVQALLEWAKMPPATEADKQEIMRLFSRYFSR